MTADDPTAALVGFARALRVQGLTIGSGQIVVYCRAMTRLNPSDPHDLYWAGRACLVNRAQDIPVYDRVFHRHVTTGRRGRVPEGRSELHAGSAETVSVFGRHRDDRQPAAGRVASSVEVLRTKEFSQLGPAERASVYGLIAALRADPPVRRTRRTGPAPRGHQPDMRRMLRMGLRTDGELVQRCWRRRLTRPRRVVLLLDVSGSMAAYSRALMTFGHALARGSGQVEVFCFGTRITRVTAQLSRREPDEALQRAAEQVLDWDGGTRIGASIDAFLRGWGRPGLARGAVVIICSDGLDRGAPGRLGTAMARLRRLTHRVVWVNPLKGHPAYQPLARGMAAALPHVDDLVSGHDLASLEALSRLLIRLR